jgi:hypothetical protein
MQKRMQTLNIRKLTYRRRSQGGCCGAWLKKKSRPPFFLRLLNALHDKVENADGRQPSMPGKRRGMEPWKEKRNFLHFLETWMSRERS